MIKALIFDFDGLIMDTETPAYESWRLMYEDYGQDLTMDLWGDALGRANGQGFDALAHLSTLVGQDFDRPTVLAQRKAKKQELAEAMDLLPGVREMLAQAIDLGLPCAIASSGDHDWVYHWIRKHGIEQQFVCIRTVEDVAQAKPAPDLFLAAAACLGLEPAECLVFEDSPNGVRAAAAAGMPCVAVPGAITSMLEMPPVMLTVKSLADMSLAEMIQVVANGEEELRNA